MVFASMSRRSASSMSYTGEGKKKHYYTELSNSEWYEAVSKEVIEKAEQNLACKLAHKVRWCLQQSLTKVGPSAEPANIGTLIYIRVGPPLLDLVRYCALICPCLLGHGQPGWEHRETLQAQSLESYS